MTVDHFMSVAFEEARSALAEGEVPVGCVFVYKNAIIAKAGNQVNATKNATRHAEFVCIDQALCYFSSHNLKSDEVFPQITVVVTVEPCIMCLAALHNLKVKEIIYGCANDRFGGKSVVDVPQILGQPLEMKAGLRAEEAMDLLKQFYKGQNPSAPVAKSKR